MALWTFLRNLWEICRLNKDEFEDCIDDYGKGKSRYVTKNELILYNCILTVFITRLEKQTDK